MRKKYTTKVRLANAIADLQSAVSTPPYFDEGETQFAILQKVSDALQISVYQKIDPDTRISVSNATLLATYSLPLSEVSTYLFDENIKTVADFISILQRPKTK